MYHFFKAKLLGDLCTAGESIGGGPPLQQALKATRKQLALVKDQGGLASLQPPDSEVCLYTNFLFSKTN